MQKASKKILCLVLIGVMMLSNTLVTNAASITSTNSIEGLDRYLSKDDNGLIFFDEHAAMNANYSQDAITFVRNNISNMNKALSNGNAILNEDFSVTTFYISTRAKGVNKTVTHWNGNVDLYMDSSAAQEFINNVKFAISIADAITNIDVPLLGFALNVSILDAKLILSMAKSAASHGTGIIMHIQRNFITQTDTYTFSPQ